MKTVKSTEHFRKMINQLYDWVESETLPCPICGDQCDTAVKDGKEITYIHDEHDNCVART